MFNVMLNNVNYNKVITTTYIFTCQGYDGVKIGKHKETKHCFSM